MYWLHRVLLGPKPSTNRISPVDFIMRANPMAQRIVKVISEDGGDLDQILDYNGAHNYLKKPEKRYINGDVVEFSPQCVPWLSLDPPAKAAFNPKDIILWGTEDARALALCSSAMSKRDGVKTFVMGGNPSNMQFGFSSGTFSEMRTEIMSTGLRGNPLALPLLSVIFLFLLSDYSTKISFSETASILSLNWRLILGVKNLTSQRIYLFAFPIVLNGYYSSFTTEYQSRGEDLTIPLGMESVNNPRAIWKQVAKVVVVDREVG
ncbi:hypothetical protein BXZ70DRAFT_1012276 [Cristinia sonorae]|uniref:Uncharacterized protein n=1 Tax=Cristinia sonorae TaxID=1940300 RepID=A0A8K0XKM9_9AGAR|nr:hypothetical protein BXZ70DRAFT_1012276 [Cristinia sonorae]